MPVINTKFMGIKIDFLFARLALARIEDNLVLHDSNLLKNLDERDVRSLGGESKTNDSRDACQSCSCSLKGSRVTDEILRLVPNVEVFRMSLRCIKLWAQSESRIRSKRYILLVTETLCLPGRAIYSNVMGFLGGVAWAMLVARICQLYPNEAAGAIVSRFFIIYYQWKWPQPVLLKNIEEGPLPVRVWNPKLYPQDRLHRMPIITPAYPSMCATHNVSQSTQMIMTQEFKRGAEIVDRIMVGSANWSELFTGHDFFHKYKYYLQVVASSGSADLQLKWSGTVESKVRQLIMKLEQVPTLMCAHPYIKGFDQKSICYNDSEVRLVATGNVPEEVAKRTEVEDLPKEGLGADEAKEKDIEAKQIEQEEGHRTIWTTTFYIGLCVEPRPGMPTCLLLLDSPTDDRPCLCSKCCWAEKARYLVPDDTIYSIG